MSTEARRSMASQLRQVADIRAQRGEHDQAARLRHEAFIADGVDEDDWTKAIAIWKGRDAAALRVEPEVSRR